MRSDILETKLTKLNNLKKNGLDPYPSQVKKDFSNQKIKEDFDKIGEREIYLAGRVRSLRPMGRSTFCHIEDESGKIQLFLNKNNIKADRYKLFVKNIEIGDFIQVKGVLFKTKTGEITLRVTDWKILSKNIRPIPTEYYGLKNKEEILRHRYLDLLLNKETKELFYKKNIFWQTIREFLFQKNFLEVQTPVMEHIPGGAEAEPFITHHNALNQDFYLRISLELALKRLLVGGYEKVFEIGKVFRNEGIDREHLQEFDHMEFYWAYADLEMGKELVQKLFYAVVSAVTDGKLVTQCGKEEINWKKKWKEIDYFEIFQKEVGIDLNQDNLKIKDFQDKAQELKIDYKKEYGQGRMIDLLYKKVIRPQLIQPVLLTGHPLIISPLAKKDPQNPKKVLRFQPIACGSELGNAFSELNDPLEQRKRFEEQMKLREKGDKEAQMIDNDFLEALEYGMPPAFGFGMSERFFSILMNKSIRETTIFPAIKRK